MKRVFLLAASIAAAAILIGSVAPASADPSPPSAANCTVVSTAADGTVTLTCPSPNAPSTVVVPAPNVVVAPAVAAAVEPSYVGTVVTTAGMQKSPGYGVDIFRRGAWNLSAIALDTSGRVPITFGVSVMSKGGVSIGYLKLPQPSPTPGTNKLGTYGVYIETRI